jgi:hypothetical protein
MCLSVFSTVKNSHSGGWNPNWVHSARRPPIGPVIVRMENLVEWKLAGKTEVLGENLPQRHFVHPKPGPPRWEASD